MKLKTLLPVWAALIFLLVPALPSSAETFTLAWDPPPEPAVTGYVLWYGTASGAYTTRVEAGTSTSFSVSGLSPATTYYFAVQAYDSAGQLSPLSKEVSGTTPMPPVSEPPVEEPPVEEPPVEEPPVEEPPVEEPPVEEPPVEEPPVEEPPVEEPPVEEPPVEEPPSPVTTPEAFAFAELTNVSRKTPVTSNAVTVSGIDVAAPIAVSAGTYSINGGPFTDLPATVQNAETVRVRLTSASGYAETTAATLTIGGVSAEFRVTTEAPPGRARKDARPAPPTGLAASLRDGRTIELSWNDPGSTRPAGYLVEVGTSPGSSEVGSFTTGVTTRFAVGSLAPATYALRVRGVTDAGVTEPSNEVVVTVEGQTEDPAAPGDVRLAVVERSARLDWNPPASGDATLGYVLEAGSASGLSDLWVLPVDSPSFVSPDLPDGAYHFRVRALGTGGAGPASRQVMALVGLPTASCSLPPGIPAGVAVSTTGAVVRLNWKPGAGEWPTGYLVEVGSAPGLSDLGTLSLGPGGTSLNTPMPKGTYAFRVVAVNSCGASAPSAGVSASVRGNAPDLPGTPTGLDYEVHGSTVYFTWSAPGDGGAPTRYIVEATDTNGQPLVTVETGNAAATFLGRDAAGPAAYELRVRAANASGIGPASPAITVVVME